MNVASAAAAAGAHFLLQQCYTHTHLPDDNIFRHSSVLPFRAASVVIAADLPALKVLSLSLFFVTIYLAISKRASKEEKNWTPYQRQLIDLAAAAGVVAKVEIAAGKLAAVGAASCIAHHSFLVFFLLESSQHTVLSRLKSMLLLVLFFYGGSFLKSNEKDEKDGRKDGRKLEKNCFRFTHTLTLQNKYLHINLRHI